jgi:pantoate--beta-alanine ligase
VEKSVSLPRIITTIAETRVAIQEAKRAGRTVAFVPTMGALHEGHAALVRAAYVTGGLVVVSIFVNPTQFGPNEDFTRYPRTLEADQKLAGDAGADLIFHPTPEEMYPGESHAYVDIEKLGDHLCGPSRPGHFRGVCTVVLKLLNIVQPDIAIFGAKDAQQARILRKMALDLNLSTTIQIEPTVREPDGLALSSRNRYLTAEERAVAPRIYLALTNLKSFVDAGVKSVPQLERRLRVDLEAIPGCRVDYASIVDDVTMQPLQTLDRPAFCAVAVFLGRTRLIDNLTL